MKNHASSGKRKPKGKGEVSRTSLESQHRSMVENFTPIQVVPIADPGEGERYIVRTFTTYGAYEDPI